MNDRVYLEANLGPKNIPNFCGRISILGVSTNFIVISNMRADYPKLVEKEKNLIAGFKEMT